MSEIPLNKFEKEEKVIELHKQGITIRQIAPIVRMSFRDISKIRRAYEKKIKLQQNKKENTQSGTKKPSVSTQAFVLFQEVKKIDEVKVLLDIPFKKAIQYHEQYLESIRMEDCYEFYKEHSYDIPTLLSISNFMKRNNVSGTNILNVLRTANDVYNLNQTYYNLKTKIEDLEQRRMYLMYTPSSPYSLEPLPLNKRY